MLKICTVYFKGHYTPDYVSNLYKSLKKHSTIPFQSVCISDTDVEADVVLPFNHFSDIRYHWHKLKFFSPMFAYQNPDDDIIIMDIDQIITNNVDDLIGHKVKKNELLTYNSWWDKDLKINGGFYKFKSGSLQEIWNKFQLNPEYWQLHYYNNGVVHKKYYGEQNYVHDTALAKGIKIKKVPGEWLFKYGKDFRENLSLQKMYCKKFKTDYAILDKPNEKIKVVHFAGPGKTYENNMLQVWG
jgi:hypothetical protein